MAKDQPKTSVGAAAVGTFLGGGTLDETMAAARNAEIGDVPAPPIVLPPTSTKDRPEAAGPPTKEADSETANLKRHVDVSERAFEGYQETLRRYNLTEEDAWRIIDTIMVRNERYQETIWLLDKRLPVVFQTQLVDDFDLLDEVLENRKPHYYAGLTSTQWRHYLAASIVRYGTKEFSMKTMDDYEHRVSWVNSLQEPVFQLLLNELSDFNKKIQAMITRSMLRHF